MSKRTKTSSFGTTKREGHDASRFYQRKIYRDAKPVKNGVSVKNKASELKESALDVIYCHDSRSMRHLPDNCVHLMVTSPPYNVGKEYDKNLTLDGYKDLLRAVLQETHRVLVDGGRACINIANIGRKPYIPLHASIIELADECGFLMRGEIIWDKGASAGTSCAWGSWKSASNPSLRDVHEYILVFSKGLYSRAPFWKSARNFLRDMHEYILVFSKGQYQRDPSKKESTIGRDDFMEATRSVWQFGTASAKKAGHPAPFPVELPRRLIHLYSYKGDVILDPFMGSGTTAVAAVQTERRFIGYELEQEYVDVARQKVLKAQSS